MIYLRWKNHLNVTDLKHKFFQAHLIFSIHHQNLFYLGRNIVKKLKNNLYVIYFYYIKKVKRLFSKSYFYMMH